MSNTDEPQVLRSLDEIKELQACFSGINELLSPAESIPVSSRDNIAILISRLLRDQKRAQSNLRTALFGGGVC